MTIDRPPASVRFDHAIVAVADLDGAAAAYRRLGFEVVAGGHHPAWGTDNALVFLDDGYLELLGVSDPATTRRLGPPGEALLGFLDAGAGGLAGFALRTDAIDADADRLAAAGVAAQGPFPMQRRRPDGSVLAWRLLVPEGRAWLTPWPFFIEWPGAPPSGPASHTNAARRVEGLTVVVDDLDRGVRRYEALLDPAATGAMLRVGGCAIDLEGPEGGAGPGLAELTIASADLTRTADAVGAAARHGEVRPPPEATHGARLVFRGPGRAADADGERL